MFKARRSGRGTMAEDGAARSFGLCAGRATPHPRLEGDPVIRVVLAGDQAKMRGGGAGSPVDARGRDRDVGQVGCGDEVLDAARAPC